MAEEIVSRVCLPLLLPFLAYGVVIVVHCYPFCLDSVVRIGWSSVFVPVQRLSIIPGRQYLIQRGVWTQLGVDDAVPFCLWLKWEREMVGGQCDPSGDHFPSPGSWVLQNNRAHDGVCLQAAAVLQLLEDLGFSVHLLALGQLERPQVLLCDGQHAVPC
ncbi:hypothetical protein VTI74DRAFT_4872 [Chaetomium olivicolor]